jgi:hypothetical protein
MTARKSCLERKRKTWWIVPADGIHVAPSGDEQVHVPRRDCWCSPMPDDGGWVIHHALDGRVWKTEEQMPGINFPWLETKPP